ncbi:AtpZ/AtpI family protein [bacterium]|nr:MAG: AtpZ/AtpI family protein [bacterium]
MATDEGQEPRGESRNKGELIRFLGVASTVGINLVLSTIIGFALGYYLFDNYIFAELLSFNTFPWFTIIFLILGIAAGFKYLFRVARKASANDRENE